MNGTALFELLASICALVAAIFIFDQHLNRPRPHKLMWTLGLLFYGIAAGAEYLGVTRGWGEGEYKAWYCFGGVLTAAFLGLGSLYLLAPRRIGHIATGIATAIALYAAIRIFFFAPFSAADMHTLATAPTSLITNVRSFKPLPGDMEAAAILMNIPGALLLFGGAAWSAWQFWRKHAGGLPTHLDGVAGAGVGLSEHPDGDAGAGQYERRGAGGVPGGALLASGPAHQSGCLYRLPRSLHAYRALRAATAGGSQRVYRALEVAGRAATLRR